MARPSMADVAAHAGVSGQTVSRVANGSPRVDPSTRARVEASMAALGYRMHGAARTLRTGRSDTIGLIVSTLSTVGNFRMVEAVADAAAARGYAVTIVMAAAEQAVGSGFDRLLDRGVDGAIVLNEASTLAQRVEVPAGLALVVVDSPPGDRYTVVQTDHAAGAREAVEHLLGLGHDTVHHLAGPAGSFAAAERERGWRTALETAGATVPTALRGDWSARSGFAAAPRLPAGATALFAANDQMALGAMRGLVQAGLTVPRDVSVIGFDDVADASEYQPPLTTVRQSFGLLGSAAVEALVQAIEGEAPADQTLPPALVLRESA